MNSSWLAVGNTIIWSTFQGKVKKKVKKRVLFCRFGQKMVKIYGLDEKKPILVKKNVK